jgi:hypothetical protein
MFHLALAPEEQGFRLSLRGRWDGAWPGRVQAPSMRALDSDIVGALLDQLGGELALACGPQGLECEVTFPRRGAASAWAPSMANDGSPRSVH